MGLPACLGVLKFWKLLVDCVDSTCIGTVVRRLNQQKSIHFRLLLAGDLLFAALFVIDVSLRMVFLKFQFWKHWINYLDLIVTILSVCEVVIALLPIDAFFFRLVRFGKLFRTDFVGPWDC